MRRHNLLSQQHKAAKFGLEKAGISHRATVCAPRPTRHTPNSCTSLLYCATRRTGKPNGLDRRRVLGGRLHHFSRHETQSRLGARLLASLTVAPGDNPVAVFAASVRVGNSDLLQQTISDVRRVRIEHTGVTVWECTAQAKNKMGKARIMLYWAVWDAKRRLLNRLCICVADGATLRANRGVVTVFLERWTRTLSTASASTANFSFGYCFAQ